MQFSFRNYIIRNSGRGIQNPRRSRITQLRGSSQNKVEF